MPQRRAAVAGVAGALAIVALYTGSGRISGHVFGFGKSNGCTVVQQPAEGDVTPVHVECRWPVPAERVQELVGDVEAHGHIFSGLAQSAVVENRDGHLLVRQVQQAKGMADREVILEWRVEPIPDGYRYQFRKAPDQSALTGMHIEVAQDIGYWEVVSDGDGARLVYELRYLPGGGVPPFLVRTFQSSAISAAMSELREAAGSQRSARSEWPAVQ